MYKQLLAMSVVLLLVSNHSTQANDVYQVGVSRVDITPDYAIRLNGFGNRRQESVGVSQQIYAKSLAISGSTSCPGHTRQPGDPTNNGGRSRWSIDDLASIARRKSRRHVYPFALHTEGEWCK